jgi:hypothetical protein
VSVDTRNLQKAHDAIIECGAECAADKSEDEAKAALAKCLSRPNFLGGSNRDENGSERTPHREALRKCLDQPRFPKQNGW